MFRIESIKNVLIYCDADVTNAITITITIPYTLFTNTRTEPKILDQSKYRLKDHLNFQNSKRFNIFFFNDVQAMSLHFCGKWRMKNKLFRYSYS